MSMRYEPKSGECEKMREALVLCNNHVNSTVMSSVSRSFITKKVKICVPLTHY